MNKITIKTHKGFTLLEILLVITLLGILFAIVLSLINPVAQLGRTRDLQRQQNLSQLEQALEKYFIDNGRQYPTSIPVGKYKEICATGVISTSNCVDLSFLAPSYLNSIPADPNGSNYKVGINPTNNTLSLWSDNAVSTEVAVNKFTPYYSGAVDTSFNTSYGFNDIVNTVVPQSDGKVLVGGNFTAYNGVTANRIIRLNSDGTQDTTFNMGTGFDYVPSSYGAVVVTSIVVQNDGKVLVGGNFSTYQGVSANGIVRLNSNGSRDASFDVGTGFVDPVWDLALQSDGKVMAVGDFVSYKGVYANRIIRLNSNGSRDTTFDMGALGFGWDANSVVVQSDGKLLVGGVFTTYKGTSVNRIVRLNSDGNIDVTFNIGTGFDDTVNAIALQSDGKILVGGVFNNYQGLSASKIIRLNIDGSRDSSFSLGSGFNQYGYAEVYSLIVQSDGKIFVGGNLGYYQGLSANGIIRLNSDGSKDTSFEVGNGFEYIEPNEPWLGDISQLAIYNRRLTASEIQQNFNSAKGRYGFTPGSSPPAIVSNGLLTYLDAGNLSSYSGAGNIWSDLSGNGNNATIYNGVSYTNSNGGSFRFDGNNDISIINLNSSTTISSISYSAWLKPDTGIDALDYATVIDFGGYDSFLMGTYYSEVIGYSPDADSGYNLNSNTWYHISMTYSNGGPVYLYVNGVLTYTSDPISGYRYTYDNFSIGAGYDYSPGYVYSIGLQSSGKIMAAGLFNSYQDQSAGYLTRIEN